MIEAEQLAILERIPGFTRPSAEWLKGLAVGDRVMFTHCTAGKIERKCLALIHSANADHVYFWIEHLGEIYASRAFGFNDWFWIGPIEPEPPQQEPAESPRPFKVGDVVRVTFEGGTWPEWIESTVRAIAEETLYLAADGIVLTHPAAAKRFVITAGTRLCLDSPPAYYFDDIMMCLDCNVEVVK
jgi:hypothetical protein